MFPWPVSKCLRFRQWKVLSGARGKYLSTSRQRPPVVAIRRETKKWETRAALNPSHVETLIKTGMKVLVEPSPSRAYSINEYKAAGAIISSDFSTADVIVGLKEIIPSELIENKTYAFAGHMIKAQEHNMPLLDAVLQKGVRLIDYESLLDKEGRIFIQAPCSVQAGMVGMVDILHGLGLRLLGLGYHTPFFHVGMAHNYPTLTAAKAAIAGLGREIQYGLMPESLGPFVFTFTGSGSVSQGAQEILREMPHEYVPPSSLKEVVETGDCRKVYATVVRRWDYLERRRGGGFDAAEFEANPEMYKSTFAERIAPYTTCLVNGLFYPLGNPRIITKEQCKNLHPPDTSHPELPHRMLAITDISCDIGGSLEFMTECTTIDKPFVIYDAHKDQMSYDMTGSGILMSSIDHLPTEVGREGTDAAGGVLLPHIQEFVKIDGTKPLQDQDVSQMVKNSIIAYNGSLTERFKYIAELRTNTQSTGHRRNTTNN